MNSSYELKNIIDKLNSQGKMYFVQGATQEQINSFEKESGIKLPFQFKEWLIYSDGGDLFLPAGIQLYGVAHRPLIEINNEYILNNNYFTIGALANGDPILCKKDDGQVSIFNQETEKIEEDEIYLDFYSFLNNLPELLGIDD